MTRTAEQRASIRKARKRAAALERSRDSHPALQSRRHAGRLRPLTYAERVAKRLRDAKRGREEYRLSAHHLGPAPGWGKQKTA